MARFSQANWKGPVPGENPGAMVRPVMGLVLHIEQGTETGTNSWFHNPGAEASAHFGNPRFGPLDQWVDTDDKAWAEAAGNSRWISVEHEGRSGDRLTASQLANDSQLYAWLHRHEGVPFQLANDPETRGLGYHAMGGAAWGGHLQCPGSPIVGQRSEILTRAAIIAGSAVLAPAPVPPPEPTVALGASGPAVALLQSKLDGHGFRLATDGRFGPLTETAVRAFQGVRGLTVDGIVGPRTWAALG